MRSIPLVLVLVLVLAPGCGGGSGGGQAAGLTTEQLLERCLAADLSDLSALIATIQGILDPDSGGPTPQLDLIAAILTGILPWSVDLDGDQAVDLQGTIFLTDPGGAITLPADLAALLGAGGPLDLDAVLALLPDGTRVHLTFTFDRLALVNGASGDGDLSVRVQGGAPADVSGGSTFASGDCSFEFSFDGLSPEILEGGGFGTGTVGFVLESGADTVAGDIVLDGTNVARVSSRRNNGPEETFLVDLTTGLAQPA
jgi:hypothetical protein